MRIPVETLYEDSELLAILKPSGILSTPDRYDARLTHVATLVKEPKPILVHRLDAETSGVMILAKTTAVHRDLNRQFEEGEVRKVYHALVNGRPELDCWTSDLPLRVDAGRKHRTRIVPDGKVSSTSFKLIEQLGPMALVEAKPRTGRTHQIRVHLAAAELPVAVDTLYGDGRPVLLSEHKRNYRLNRSEVERPLLGRLGLHAASITLVHPGTGELLTVEAPYPKDFRATVNQLRKRYADKNVSTHAT